jgi:tRNA threonylcarbamoyladenosine biosynthesis protein TsaE
MSFPYLRKSNSEEDTTSIADEFSGMIKAGMVIVLNGELGVGKTFFIKKILEKNLINNSNSPTFAIVNEFEGEYKFYHFDFYRINTESELHDIGIEDYFRDLESIIFIEWGNLFPNVLPKKRIEINITSSENGERIFNFKQYE